LRRFFKSLEDCEARAYINFMSPRGLIPVVPLLAMCIPAAFGQLPKRVEKCLPYPTLAQEIREMQPVSPLVRVRVAGVDFDSKDDLPTDVREEISTALRSRTFERDADPAYLNDLDNEIGEVDVHGILQNHGYFRATAAVKLSVLKADDAEISVAAAITAAPGPQYRAGDIRVESTDGGFPLEMSAEGLRDLIPLQRSELFDVEKVRAGLRNLTLAYGRRGYVDMTAEPDFQIDEDHNIIDMVVKIDRQAEYRVGGIEFLGIDALTREKLMKSLPKPGDVFDSTQLDEFFKVNRAILPSDVSRDDVNVKRDPKSKTVAILFDFRTCPPHSN
jgi:outer membrane protein assembly factor BamA